MGILAYCLLKPAAQSFQTLTAALFSTAKHYLLIDRWGIKPTQSNMLTRQEIWRSVWIQQSLLISVVCALLRYVCGICMYVFTLLLIMPSVKWFGWEVEGIHFLALPALTLLKSGSMKSTLVWTSITEDTTFCLPCSLHRLILGMYLLFFFFFFRLFLLVKIFNWVLVHNSCDGFCLLFWKAPHRHRAKTPPLNPSSSNSPEDHSTGIDCCVIHQTPTGHLFYIC